MNVASLELCKELYELSGWEYDEDHRHIEKVWIEFFSTSEMGQGHPDYDKTPPEGRRQYHVGEYMVRDNPKNQVGIPENVPWGWANKYYEETVKRSVPAYDLGYLLRKLPRDVPNDDNGGSYYLDMHIVPGVEQPWTICYDNAFDQKYKVDAYADTPEDAACRLAIQLFKQGILER